MRSEHNSAYCKYIYVGTIIISARNYVMPVSYLNMYVNQITYNCGIIYLKLLEGKIIRGVGLLKK